MNSIDLIPVDVRRERWLYAWFRALFIGAAAVIAVVAISYGGLSMQANTLREEINVLEELRAVTAQQRTELEDLSRNKSNLTRQLSMLQGLRSGAPAKAVFLAIDKALSGADVWFLNWQFRRAGVIAPENQSAAVETGYFIVVPEGSGREVTNAWQVETHLTIQGQARNHETLSQFVDELFGQKAVVDVSVQKTELRSYGDVDVVDFDLAVVLIARRLVDMRAQLKTLDNRQLQLVGIGAITLLLAALMSSFVLPKWRAYTAANSSLQLLQSSVEQGATIDAELAILNDEVAALERQLNGDAANLPAKKMQAFVIGRLQTISWRNDIELIGIKPRNGTPIAHFNELIFDVELRGDYFDFYDWLGNVGEELGFVVVKNFEMSPLNGRAAASDPMLKVKLTVASYRNRGAS